MSELNTLTAMLHRSLVALYPKQDHHRIAFTYRVSPRSPHWSCELECGTWSAPNDPCEAAREALQHLQQRLADLRERLRGQLAVVEAGINPSSDAKDIDVGQLDETAAAIEAVSMPPEPDDDERIPF